jgi:peptidyl-prolyl cis-trans isomerase SurA
MKKLILFITYLLLTSYAISESLGTTDALLAVVGDQVITVSDVQKYTTQEEGALAREFSGQDLTRRLVSMRRNALDNLIAKELIWKEFEAMKAKLPQDLVQERLDQLVMRVAGGNWIKFEEMLFKEGMTAKEFKEKLYKDVAVELLTRDRIERGITIPESDVETFYAENAALFAKPRSYHLGIIQLKKDGRHADRLKIIEEIIVNGLAQGQDFAEMAQRYSEDEQAANGGDHGWLSDLDPRLIEKLKESQPGQILPPMELGNSIYIVRVMDIDGSGVQQLTPEVRKDIRNRLKLMEQEQRYKAFIKELSMKYPVRRLDKKPVNAK